MIRSFVLTLLLTASSSAAPLFLSVNNFDANNNRLVTVDFGNGTLTDVGGIGLTNVDIEGLALNPTNFQLFGIDDNQDRLIRIDPITGAGAVISSFGFDVDDVGLTFGATGTLYFANIRTSDSTPELYTVNTTTGAATLVGSLSQKVNGLAFYAGTLYGLGNTQLLTINPATASVNIVGSLGLTVLDGELAFDAAGNGYGVRDLAPDNSGSTQLFQINRLTGAATPGATIGTTVTLESLTSTVPEPGTIVLISAAAAIFGLSRFRRQARS